MQQDTSFISAVISKLRAVVFVLCFIMVSGIVSYIAIPKEYFPDVQIPIFSILVQQRGISVYDSEKLIIRPLEQKLRGIEGVKDIKSKAFEGGASIIMEFYTGFDLTKAKTDVKDKVDEARPLLPREIDEPIVDEVNLSLFPILLIKLSGDVPDRILYDLAQKLQDEIESKVSSVLKAGLVGDREEVIELQIDPRRLYQYNLGIDSVAAIINANNTLVSSGVIESKYGRFPIKIKGCFTNLEEMYKAPLLAMNGKVVVFDDVAFVRSTFEDPKSFARDRGVNAVVIEVTKRTGENIIETVKKSMEVVSTFTKDWPKSIKINFAQDQSKKINDLLLELLNTLLLTFILVMVVIILSLGWRSAMLVAISLPGSFLSSILFLHACGYTINIIVLFGLIFAVGMLVDGSIIVVEYADKKMEEGESAMQAYIEAAVRMKWPVITSISTILVVFIPLLFWPGMVGKVLKFLPITLLSTLTASIAMALIFVPAIGAYFGKLPDHKQPEASFEDVKDILKVGGLTGKYVNYLNIALNHPLRVISGAIIALFIVSTTYFKSDLGVEFFPISEPENAMVHVRAKGNLSVYEKDELVKKVEEIINPIVDIDSVYTKAGSIRDANMESSGNNGATVEDEIGSIMIEFSNWRTRRKADEITGEINEKCAKIPGIKVSVENEKQGPSKSPINFDVFSTNNNFDKIIEITEELRDYIAKMPGISLIKDYLPLKSVEFEYVVDRAEALKYGANITLIGKSLQMATSGVLVGTYKPDEKKEEVDIFVRFPENFRTIEELEKLRVKTQLGLMPVSNFIKKVKKVGLSTLTRSDGRASVNMEADLYKGYYADDYLQKIQQWFDEKKLSDDVGITFKGDARDQAESAKFLGGAFACAILMMIFIMLLEFNSFFSTFLVLSAILMSTVGVFLGLWLRQMPFIITMGGIGIIGLAGIIVSNNIILIDTFDGLHEKIKNGRERILKTCAQRLRPVFLTKITVILGMLPIMYGINIDFFALEITVGAPSTALWKLLSTCIVSGVLFASIMTLFFTPCALMVRENFKERRLKKKAEKS